MEEYKKILHVCYYHPETKHVMGVFPEEYPGLNQYPFELINYKLARPFYYGEMGFDGSFRILKIKNKISIVLEKTKNKISKELSKYPIYKLEFENNKKIDQSDFVIEIKNNKVKLFTHININEYPEQGITIFITEKNNPFFLIKKLFIPFNKVGYINLLDSNINVDDISIFTKNINSKTILVKDYHYYSKKPFLLICIKELNKTILTTNPQYFSIENYDKEASILLKQKNENKKIYISNAINSFYLIENIKILDNQANYDKVTLSINEFSKFWLEELLKEINQDKILYDKNKIVIFTENNIEKDIFITPKNNPFEILYKVHKNEIINYKNLDFELSAVITCKETNKLINIDCERINDL